MQFDDIELIYAAPDFIVKKGKLIKITMEIDKDLDGYYQRNLPSIINNWTFPKGNKDIKPFKLINFNAFERGFNAEIEIIIKDKDSDELMLFCQDMLDVFNYDKTHVLKWVIIDGEK